MAATLPLLLITPSLEGVGLPVGPGDRAEWAAARQFAINNEAGYLSIIMLSRLAGVLWSIVGGITIYLWATDLYGPRGGLVSLIVWCFGPNVLAHAPLATPDIPASVSGVVATYAFWRYLKSGTWSMATLAGLLLGIAQVTKFTMLALYGVWPILAIACSINRSGELARAVRVRIRLLQCVAIFLLSIWVINTCYLFDGTFERIGDYQFVSRLFAGEPASDGQMSTAKAEGNRFRESSLCALPMPLPHDYLAGLDVQRRDLEGENMSPSYLRGEWRKGGWWYYYLYGLAVKVPVGTLALAFGSIVLAVRRIHATHQWTSELALWLPVLIIIIAASSQTGFNHHLRYVLPIAPFVAIATGGLARHIAPDTRAAGWFVCAMLIWSVTSSLLVYPHSLSYFNELSGGPSKGHEHLAGSNVDWGQDLLFFVDWAQAHPQQQPVFLIYSNYVDNIAYKFGFCRPTLLRPGWYAVDLHSIMEPGSRYLFFSKMDPVARAGYSILIYRIDEEDILFLNANYSTPVLD